MPQSHGSNKDILVRQERTSWTTNSTRVLKWWPTFTTTSRLVVAVAWNTWASKQPYVRAWLLERTRRDELQPSRVRGTTVYDPYYAVLAPCCLIICKDDDDGASSSVNACNNHDDAGCHWRRGWHVLPHRPLLSWTRWEKPPTKKTNDFCWKTTFFKEPNLAGGVSSF